LITLFAFSIVIYVFQIQFGVTPEWAVR